MRAGDLTNRILIQRPVDTGRRNQVGEPEIIWADVCTVWAAVEPVRGREYWAAQQVNGEATVRIRMRYRPGIDRTMRVLFGGRILQLISPPINVQERNVELQLMCVEVENSGQASDTED